IQQNCRLQVQADREAMAEIILVADADKRTVHPVRYDVRINCDVVSAIVYDESARRYRRYRWGDLSAGRVHAPRGKTRGVDLEAAVHGPPPESLPNPGEAPSEESVAAVAFSLEDGNPGHEVVLIEPWSKLDAHNVGRVPDAIKLAGYSEPRVPVHGGEARGFERRSTKLGGEVVDRSSKERVRQVSAREKVVRHEGGAAGVPCRKRMPPVDLHLQAVPEAITDRSADAGRVSQRPEVVGPECRSPAADEQPRPTGDLPVGINRAARGNELVTNWPALPEKDELERAKEPAPVEVVIQWQRNYRVGGRHVAPDLRPSCPWC